MISSASIPLLRKATVDAGVEAGAFSIGSSTSGWRSRRVIVALRYGRGTSMTKFLASVRDVSEAEIALAAGADIIDLKEPARGALGAVEPAIIAAAVRRI